MNEEHVVEHNKFYLFSTPQCDLYQAIGKCEKQQQKKKLLHLYIQV